MPEEVATLRGSASINSNSCQSLLAQRSANPAVSQIAVRTVTPHKQLLNTPSPQFGHKRCGGTASMPRPRNPPPASE